MTRTELPRPTPQTILQDRLAHCAEEGVDGINARLDALDSEWTAGRLVKATLGVAIVIGFALAAFFDPLWLLLPAVAGAFLLQYVFFRRSILAELFRTIGFRGGAEIEEERRALRTLRGDFHNLPTVAQVEDNEAVSRLVDEGGPALDDDEDRISPREAAAIIATATH